MYVVYTYHFTSLGQRYPCSPLKNDLLISPTIQTLRKTMKKKKWVHENLSKLLEKFRSLKLSNIDLFVVSCHTPAIICMIGYHTTLSTKVMLRIQTHFAPDSPPPPVFSSYSIPSRIRLPWPPNPCCHGWPWSL